MSGITERRYAVSLTWDEMDEAMAALRQRIAVYEAESARDPEMVSELDQAIAGWWVIVHRMGDARRVAHGLDPLIDDCEPDWTSLRLSDVVGD